MDKKVIIAAVALLFAAGMHAQEIEQGYYVKRYRIDEVNYYHAKLGSLIDFDEHRRFFHEDCFSCERLDSLMSGYRSIDCGYYSTDYSAKEMFIEQLYSLKYGKSRRAKDKAWKAIRPIDKINRAVSLSPYYLGKDGIHVYRIAKVTVRVDTFYGRDVRWLPEKEQAWFWCNSDWYADRKDDVIFKVITEVIAADPYALAGQLPFYTFQY